MICLVLPAGGLQAAQPGQRVFPYNEAETGRQLARRECKPLVVHFFPDTRLGSEQLEALYSGPERIPQSVLDKLVIVAVPTERFSRFARNLGLTTPGGYRTLSGYDLNPFDEKAVATCRVGFR
jgi:hypothetical protein